MNIESTYPQSFLILRTECDFTGLNKWWVLPDDLIKARMDGLKERYPKHPLRPFAKRQDNDFIACFTEDDKVIVFKDYANRSIDFTTAIELSEWLKLVMEQLIEDLQDEIDGANFKG